MKTPFLDEKPPSTSINTNLVKPLEAPLKMNPNNMGIVCLIIIYLPYLLNILDEIIIIIVDSKCSEKFIELLCYVVFFCEQLFLENVVFFVHWGEGAGGLF